MFQNYNKDTRTTSATLFWYFIVNFEQVWFIFLVFPLCTLNRQMTSVRSLLYIWKNVDVANSWLFFVLWTMSTENRHYLDFPAPLPIYSSPHTYYFWEFHPTFSCLFKISPFVTDLGVGYKVKSKFAKINSAKKKFWTIPRQQIPEKKTVWTLP